MSYTVQTKDLQVGMRMVNPILGKKGNIKVNKGEVLSEAHVKKLNKWKGVDEANPRGLEVESSRATGSEMPNVVKEPWKSPVIEQKSKQNLQSKMTVPVSFDSKGNIIGREENKVIERKKNGTNNIKPRRAKSKKR